MSVGANDDHGGTFLCGERADPGTDGFFGPFFDLADRAVGSGFLKAGHRALAQRATSIAEVMAQKTKRAL